MTKSYRFQRLIEKYYVTFTVQMSSDGHYDEDTGDYVESVAQDITMQGAIVHARTKQIYNSGGRVTEEDCFLYILEPLSLKTRVLYKGREYSVELAEDFSDYTDFYYYRLKAVSSFARS
ncbi:hypothetical protein [Sporosarcina sp. P17b]|uniref:hypothetical protein n=1 Tax=Sporosarcina sp. P17b TaxID=2048260 RepID=UPI000C1643E1|nr:hypothetical protein [Sporosarcina sp. P17b]PIC73339.1 hypothetical protein CSV76_11010 [Sporosarcina sp. P17b]